MNPNTVTALYNVMDEDVDRSIGNEYDFQKLYIEKKKNIEKAVKNLYDKFGINPKIAEEYKDYMYVIDAEKYNL